MNAIPSECRTGAVNRRAFTLLETLIALAVFALSVMGLLFAMEVSVDASRAVQRERAIRQELENRLARLALPELREFSDKQEVNGVAYREEIRREQIKADQLSVIPGFWRIAVKAEWKEGREPKTWELSHLVWNP